MGQIKPREERLPLVLPARLRADKGWRDVTVCNVSSRGMMLRCSTPPARNTFIEVRHESLCFVGRVIWSSGSQFGIRTQDKIDCFRLLSSSPAAARPAGAERRTRPRSDKNPVSIRTLPLEETSRVFARLFDFSVLAIALAIGAVTLADGAGEALEPLGRAEAVLAAPRAVK